jgi:hypothetical protein
MQINVKKRQNKNENNIKVKKRMKKQDWSDKRAEIRRR